MRARSVDHPHRTGLRLRMAASYELMVQQRQRQEKHQRLVLALPHALGSLGDLRDQLAAEIEVEKSDAPERLVAEQLAYIVGAMRAEEAEHVGRAIGNLGPRERALGQR